MQPQDHPSPTPSAASSEVNEPPSPASSAKRALKRSSLASLALRAGLSWMRWGRADGAGEEELSALPAKQLLKQWLAAIFLLHRDAIEACGCN